MRPKRILVLGGTRDARLIANWLVALGHDVTSSLAGVTAAPVLPAGKIRVGGFGGAEGLRRYLDEHDVEIMIDATHPFAALISENARIAASLVPLLRLDRPAWTPKANDQWSEVQSIKEAVAALPSGACVMLTIGRKEVAPFFARSDLSGVVRTIEPPEVFVPERWRVMQERPPFSLQSELALMKGFSHLVTKNSGGDDTAEKLVAARQLGKPVVMIARPAKTGGEVYRSVDELINRLS